MGVISIILGTLGVIGIVEGILLTLFPKQSKSITRKLLKIDNFKKIGLIELVVGIGLLLIAIFLRGY